MLARGWLLGVAVAGASQGSTPPEQDVRPGTALPPEQPKPEAARYEALLQAEPVLQGEDSVEKRRRFDERWLHLGIGLGAADASLLTSLYAEIDVLDRVAVGPELGLTLWGPLIGGYARARPLIWGGQGRGLLHALTLQASYRYMHYGDQASVDLLPCIHGDCEDVTYVTMPVHFVALEAGLEHAFASGWTIRYAAGWALLASNPAWQCRVGRQSAPCADEIPPADSTFVTSFVASRALF